MSDTYKSIPHILFLSTYPPRECGLATFTHDLRSAICHHSGESQAGVIAMAKDENAEYPPEVIFEIRHDVADDYAMAADYANHSTADVVSLQHEFGIFGAEGRHILEFLKNLRKPVVTTLHTVLKEPSKNYRDCLIEVAGYSDHLVVLNSLAIPILKSVYGVPEEKIHLIHHGVPDVPFLDPNYYKDRFGVEGRTVFLTFGLLGRNKGIEVALEALAQVAKRHSEVVYIVLGATHPEVKRREGEQYRAFLQQRVRELGLQPNVIFHNHYVDLGELLEYIGACDIYLTPYHSKEQIVSGTLAYAVGMGKAVVSTPYLYAEELLAEGRGRLVDFGDSEGLARALIELIEQEAIRHCMRKRAYQYGRQMIWPEVGKKYLELFSSVSGGQKISPAKPISVSKNVWHIFPSPSIKLDHLVRLTDDTGIIQHAKYGIPDRRFGYSSDDAARALVVLLMHYERYGERAALDLARKCLSFLHHAQLPDGSFHNFMSYDRKFVDSRGSEDTLGRALWGLGEAAAHSPDEHMSIFARSMFEAAIGAADFHHPRAMAYAICGMSAFLERYRGAAAVRRKMIALSRKLINLFEQNSRAGWRWFGEEITYGNAKLPHSLLLAHKTTREERFKEVALESLEFLLSATYRDGYFDFAGNHGWYRRGGDRAVFAQQPIEAGYTAEACAAAYEVTGQQRYRRMSEAAVEWLLGRNRLNAPLYDFHTGACADGLESHGASLNQGAESAICAMLGFLAASAQCEQAIESAHDGAEQLASASLAAAAS
jgi:glycosyltransferase involved in cell wall biosynthesis